MVDEVELCKWGGCSGLIFMVVLYKNYECCFLLYNFFSNVSTYCISKSLYILFPNNTIQRKINDNFFHINTVLKNMYYYAIMIRSGIGYYTIIVFKLKI